MKKVYILKAVLIWIALSSFASAKDADFYIGAGPMLNGEINTEESEQSLGALIKFGWNFSDHLALESGYSYLGRLSNENINSIETYLTFHNQFADNLTFFSSIGGGYTASQIMPSAQIGVSFMDNQSSDFSFELGYKFNFDNQAINADIQSFFMTTTYHFPNEKPVATKQVVESASVTPLVEDGVEEYIAIVPPRARVKDNCVNGQSIVPYKVVKDDWLSKIARKFDVTMEDIESISKNTSFFTLKRNLDLIYPGEIIYLQIHCN